MNVVLLVAFVLATLGLGLLLYAVRARAARGLGRGKTIALDDVTLYSERLKLVGRPDRIVKEGNTYIPEEWKSAKRVSHGHRLQLGAYFILIEEKYGVRPPYGVVVLGDGSRVTVQNTDALRADVLAIAEAIRVRRARLTQPVPVSQPANKCRRCGQRANCSQASA
jgi:CRISPR-associated exonuclease Cas4